uniref:GATA-type domain-containing protein n=1 Tax=Nelumbo nucifera TaxID=4432 RepID=A0A822Y9I4_NELNU|nr:TPA_asm: hypothetical protein HUJ06_009595 [Nelumbo nucifera]
MAIETAESFTLLGFNRENKHAVVSNLREPIAVPLLAQGSESGDMSNAYSDAVLSSQLSDTKKRCAECHTTKAPQWKGGHAGPKPLCNACWMRYKKKKMSFSDLNREEKESEEVKDDLLVLLDNCGPRAVETVKRYSNELSAKLGHMEQQLEELLDIVMSKCRPMSLTEKQELRNLIQKMPPKNLDRIVEIVQRNKQEESHSCKEISIELEKEVISKFK